MSYNPFDEIAQRLERIESQNALLIEQLSALNSSKKDEEYLTRKDTAKTFEISLPTLDNYTRKGVIKGYRFGSRIRYKKSEVEASLNQIRTK